MYVCVHNHARACERERESKEYSLPYFYKVCVCDESNVTTSFVNKLYSVNSAM
jgi:hypothetical protein